MKNFTLILKFLISSFILVSSFDSFSVPADPKPGYFKQGDGSLLYIYLKGDEKTKWAETFDGYTILLNQDGVYEYAQQDSHGNLVLSGVKVSNVSDRSPSEILFLDKLPTKLFYSTQQLQVLKQVWDIDAQIQTNSSFRSLIKDGQSAPVTYRMPIILVNFKDVKFSFTKQDFLDLLNQVNYSKDGASGSVYDYFYDNSLGKLSFAADVFGVVELEQNRAYYGGNQSATGGSDANPRAMVREAVCFASSDLGCDFSLYDLDEDGTVDGVHIIFAGKGEESSWAEPEAIWSHAWTLNPPQRLNGKNVYRYSCSPELNRYGGISSIGVIVHEISHVMGLPDFYDTDYGNDGHAVDLGEFDVMAGGSWNNDGKTPPMHNAWSKAKLNWQSKIELLEPASLVLGTSDTSKISYYYTTPTFREYFLMENRRKQGWDAYIPSDGLIVYHVDENNFGWYSNCINCKSDRRGFYIKQANGGLGSDMTMGPGTSFPGTTRKTQFTDSSTPDSKSWQGENTMKPISNIEEVSKLISFDFKGGALIPTDTLHDLYVICHDHGKLYLTYDAIRDTSLTFLRLKKGSEIQMRAEPAQGYRLKSWSDGDTSLLVKNYRLEKDDTIQVWFEKISDIVPPLIYCKIEIKQPEHGLITVFDSMQNSLKTGDSLVAGSLLTCEVTPNPPYLLKEWWDGSTLNPREMRLTRDTSISVDLKSSDTLHDLYVICHDHGKLYLTYDAIRDTSLTFLRLKKGSEIQMRAEPVQGYRLKSWSDGDTSLLVKNYRLEKDDTIQVWFEKISDILPPLVYYKIEIKQPEHGLITVIDSMQNSLKTGDSLVAGSLLTCEVTANPPYLFKEWWDGSTLNPREIRLTRDTSISVDLKINVSLQVSKSNPPLLYSSASTLYIKNLNVGELVSIYTVEGKSIYKQKVVSSVLEVPLQKGLYVVSINGVNFKIVL